MVYSVPLQIRYLFSEYLESFFVIIKGNFGIILAKKNNVPLGAIYFPPGGTIKVALPVTQLLCRPQAGFIHLEPFSQGLDAPGQVRIDQFGACSGQVVRRLPRGPRLPK